MLFSLSLILLMGFCVCNERVLAAEVAHVLEARGKTGNPKTMINLINGTPYDWVLRNMHSYQMYCE